MQVRNRIKKAAAISLAVGSLAVAGLGLAGPAYADGPERADGVQTPPPAVQPQPVVQQPQTIYSNYQWYRVSPQTVYQQQLAYQQIYWSNLYNANYYNNVYAYSTGVQNNAALIATAAEVLNTPAQTIVSELSYGKTLTTIAAQRGWARQSFLNALINRLQVKVANGSVNAVAGNALIASLVSNPASVIDQPGATWVLQGMPAGTWYAIFR
ncbi:MAG TPA: hypothetical protein VJB57_08990 [Dehalococcoidia bacterium]|nr:hypothetical protein [Dehalococcoidia bacterium]